MKTANLLQQKGLLRKKYKGELDYERKNNRLNKRTIRKLNMEQDNYGHKCKKIENQFYQEDKEKILYVVTVYPYVNILSKERFYRFGDVPAPDHHCLKIPNDEITANQIVLFNKVPFRRKSARIYYILFNENLYETSLFKQCK